MGLLSKEKIRSLWEQTLCFNKIFHFQKGRNRRKSLLYPVVYLLCVYLFQRSGCAIAGPYCCKNDCIENKIISRCMLDQLTFFWSSYCLIVIEIRKVHHVVNIWTKFASVILYKYKITTFQLRLKYFIVEFIFGFSQSVG